MFSEGLRELTGSVFLVSGAVLCDDATMTRRTFLFLLAMVAIGVAGEVLFQGIWRDDWSIWNSLKETSHEWNEILAEKTPTP